MQFWNLARRDLERNGLFVPTVPSSLLQGRAGQVDVPRLAVPARADIDNLHRDGASRAFHGETFSARAAHLFEVGLVESCKEERVAE